jgi:uncharacterized protein (UPF0303 family)
MGLKEQMDHIAMQERELALPRFDTKVAWDLGTRLRNFAVERNYEVVIDVRRFAQPLFYAAMEGTTPDNPEWVRRKCNTVARFHHSTLWVNLRMQSKNSTLQDRYGLPLADYVSDGGSFPLTVEAAGVIGSATISGLTPLEDHNLVVEALCAMLGRNYADLRLHAE